MKTTIHNLRIKRAQGWVKVRVTVVRDGAGALIYRLYQRS